MSTLASVGAEEAYEAKMVSGYLSRMKTARMAGYEPPTKIQGVDFGLRSCLMDFRLNCFAKRSTSAKACAVLRNWNASGGVLIFIGSGVELPSTHFVSWADSVKDKAAPTEPMLPHNTNSVVFVNKLLEETRVIRQPKKRIGLRIGLPGIIQEHWAARFVRTLSHPKSVIESSVVFEVAILRKVVQWQLYVFGDNGLIWWRWRTVDCCDLNRGRNF